MRTVSKILAIAFACCLGAALLVSCGGGFSAKNLVQGNMDVIYLDTASDEYCKAVDITKEQAHQEYLDGLDVEADYLASMFEIDYDKAAPGTRDKVIDLLDTIYANSKYKIGNDTKNGDVYVVQVEISPIKVLMDFYNGDFMTGAQDINGRMQNNEYATEQDFETAWANMVIDGLTKQAANVDYYDPQTISVQVTQKKSGSDTYWSIDDADFSRIDTLILAYREY